MTESALPDDRLEEAFPAPDPHHVGPGERMAEFACTEHHLTAMVGIMLNQVGHHVDRSAGQASQTRLATAERVAESVVSAAFVWRRARRACV